MDIPLYPLAKTLIRRARSMRVLSGDRGGPTPNVEKVPDYIMQREREREREKRERGHWWDNMYGDQLREMPLRYICTAIL